MEFEYYDEEDILIDEEDLNQLEMAFNAQDKPAEEENDDQDLPVPIMSNCSQCNFFKSTVIFQDKPTCFFCIKKDSNIYEKNEEWFK